MNINFKHLPVVFITIFSIISLTTCSCSSMKIHPEYIGVDPKVQSYVDEYKTLAKIQGITFKHEVTIGFKRININNVVGLCTYGNNWREIDLDLDFFESSTSTAKNTLVMHELMHCYCNRGHDFQGKSYPSVPELERLAKEGKIGGFGFYSDLCPKSFVFPMVLQDECVFTHYNDYIKEQFENCRPF